MIKQAFVICLIAIAAPFVSAKSGLPGSLLVEAENATREYDIERARDYIGRYRHYFGRNTDRMNHEALGLVERRLDRISSMLARVEKIEVIDSVNVDSTEFFKYYNLSRESGRLASGENLPMSLGIAEGGMVYMTQDSSQVFWSGELSDSQNTLFTSHRLSDGSWESPVMLDSMLNDGGNADYPYLMSDGATLYYANDGENSIGGYDIFVTRHDGDGYLQPQNVGMPYNSPYNDYMLVIDEATGLGWFASDRNQFPGIVTIYIFISSDVRENYPVDTPDIKRFAMLSSIRETQQSGRDYSEFLRRAESRDSVIVDADEEFLFVMPGGTVYTRFDQFHSAEARYAMEDYLNVCHEIDAVKARLSEWRQAYGRGDETVSRDILRAERRLLNLHEQAKRMANRVVTHERK